MTNLDEAADHLVNNDYNLIYDLVYARVSSGLTWEEVADRMGVTVDRVLELECYWADPTLSILRRYALAVGASYATSVTKTGVGVSSR